MFYPRMFFADLVNKLVLFVQTDGAGHFLKLVFLFLIICVINFNQLSPS